MPLLPVNDANLPEAEILRAALACLPPRAPVVVMIHGYRYSPSQGSHDPHQLILSPRQARGRRGIPSWPRHLGMTGQRGLAIGWGWEARGTIWSAYRRSGDSGLRLARLIGMIHAIDPGRPVHLIAHSLGARSALTALPHLPAGAIDRIILMAAAVFRTEATALLDSPAGRSASIVHVTGRENLFFDMLLAACLPWAGPTVAQGVLARNWLDLPLDRRSVRDMLAGLGYRIGPRGLPVCHWSGYLRPGVWQLYRTLVHRPERMPLPVLRDAIADALNQQKTFVRSLSFRQETSS